jgi:hypothetical protein
MIAADQPTMPPALANKGGFLDEPTFEHVVFGTGDVEQRFSFAEFRELPLRLLLSKPPRFYVGNQEIPRSQAMRFHG